MLHDDLYDWIASQDWSDLTDTKAWAKLDAYVPKSDRRNLYVDLSFTTLRGKVVAITLSDEDCRIYHTIWRSK